MRILIVEDDYVSRKFLLKFLSKYGECDIVVDGIEALDAFLFSLKTNNTYDLICLDVMMPKIDGIRVLKTIRDLEKQKNMHSQRKSKVILTTALSGTEDVNRAFEIGCDAFATKPIDTEKFLEVMRNLELIY